jgi:hypothetical protein
MQTEIDGDSLFMRWAILPGKAYKVFYKDDLSATEWLEWPGEVTLTGSVMSIQVNSSENVQRFYRVLEY